MCEYLTDTFSIECFGNCMRVNPLDDSPVDMTDAFDECAEEVTLQSGWELGEKIMNRHYQSWNLVIVIDKI